METLKQNSQQRYLRSDRQDHGTRGNSLHWKEDDKDYDRRYPPSASADKKAAISEQVEDWLRGVEPTTQELDFHEKSDSGDYPDVYSTQVNDEVADPVAPSSAAYERAREILDSILDDHNATDEDRAIAEGMFKSSPDIRYQLLEVGTRMAMDGGEAYPMHTLSDRARADYEVNGTLVDDDYGDYQVSGATITRRP